MEEIRPWFKDHPTYTLACKTTEAATIGVLYKKVFLEISQNTSGRLLLKLKLQAQEKLKTKSKFEENIEIDSFFSSSKLLHHRALSIIGNAKALKDLTFSEAVAWRCS